MDEIEGYRQRVEAARRELASLPRSGWGEPGPPDEQTGERWDRGNVLGHMAEMIPYWTAQVRAILQGGAELGRDELGSVQRRQGIESGHEAGEEALLRRIDQGLERLLGLLGELRDEDLSRPVTYHGASTPAREADVRYAVRQLLVGHVEEHLRQLQALA